MPEAAGLDVAKSGSAKNQAAFSWKLMRSVRKTARESGGTPMTTRIYCSCRTSCTTSRPKVIAIPRTCDLRAGV